MKFFYVFLLLIIASTTLQSQTIEVAPAQGNPVVKSFSNQQYLQKAAESERLTGVKPPAAGGEKSLVVCPPVPTGNVVQSGSVLFVEIDTADLDDDTLAGILTIFDNSVPQFGSAELTGTKLKYTADDGITGTVTDTVRLIFVEPADSDTLDVLIFVKRKGKTLVADAKLVQPESVNSYCLDDELDFPKAKACADFLPCSKGYDGNGQQNFYFNHYYFPDTCLTYWASRFPGTDTVCLRICDETAVCDTFKIPFVVSGDTLSALPFFDDFSSYRGPYPSRKLWLDDLVFVNSTLAKDPPSVGFATLDGLNRQGDPYPGSGIGDRLTSKPIDLSGLTVGSNVTMRFFYAPKGYGLEPGITDSLILEFRTNDRKWVKVAGFGGMDEATTTIDVTPPFQFHALALDDPKYFHEAFQFRFSSYTSPGSGDLWHVDYVRLAANEGVSNTFPDLAFTELPTSILKNYTSLPWRHFDGYEDAELQDQLEAHFYNHFDLVKALGNDQIRHRETTTGTELHDGFTVTDENNIPVKTPTLLQRTIPGNVFNELKSELKGISDGFRNLQTEYGFIVSDQNDQYLSNDTVRLNNPFADYFAHDDGTAEWQVFIQWATGTQQLATKFHANVPDTLKAVQIMFPHVNANVESQLFTLRILSGDPAEPIDSAEIIFERELLKPFYPNNLFDTLQGFTTYRLEDFAGTATPVAVPPGDFYVVFQQLTATQFGIPIGLDLQNPCECNYVNLTGNWKPLSPTTFPGALMMRPVFSKIAPVNTSNGSTEQPAAADLGIEIFPNPTTGTLRFDLEKGNYADYKVLVFNATGQLVTQAGLTREMVLENVEPGTYFLQFVHQKTGERYVRKVLLVK